MAPASEEFILVDHSEVNNGVTDTEETEKSVKQESIESPLVENKHVKKWIDEESTLEDYGIVDCDEIVEPPETKEPLYSEIQVKVPSHFFYQTQILNLCLRKKFPMKILRSQKKPLKSSLRLLKNSITFKMLPRRLKLRFK